jgi:hypothetical protein
LGVPVMPAMEERETMWPLSKLNTRPSQPQIINMIRRINYYLKIFSYPFPWEGGVAGLYRVQQRQGVRVIIRSGDRYEYGRGKGQV